MSDEKFAKHTEKIREYGLEIGYPEEALDLFCSVVFWEWDRKIFMKDYATMVDWSSPDYREAIAKHNKNLRTLRKNLESTAAGRKSIKRIPKEQDDGTSTIIFPSLPAEYGNTDAFVG